MLREATSWRAGLGTAVVFLGSALVAAEGAGPGDGSLTRADSPHYPAALTTTEPEEDFRPVEEEVVVAEENYEDKGRYRSLAMKTLISMANSSNVSLAVQL